MAQKKQSLSLPKQGPGPGPSATNSQLNLTMPPLEGLLHSWKQNPVHQPMEAQPTAQTHKFLPNLRLKKNSVVHNQKGIQKIRQGHQRSKKEPEHGRVSSLESEGGGASPIVIGLPSMPTENEVASKYLETGRYKLDSSSPLNATNTAMGDTFSIKQLLSVQQMAGDHSQPRTNSLTKSNPALEGKTLKM